MSRQPPREGGGRIAIPELASFVGAKRTHLQGLAAATVTAGLREAVAEVFRPASLRPQACPRSAAIPAALDRGPGWSQGRAPSDQEVA